MRPSTTALRYAQAAFEVAQADGDVRGWLADLQAARDTLQDPELSQYFKNPNIGREEKLNALQQLFGTLRPHVLNLLRVVAAKQRMYLLPGVVQEFERLDREARGITEAKVTVARPVSEAEREQISQRLSQVTGKQVDITIQVHPQILGGILVRIGDRLIDSSVAGRLQRLRQELAV
jgi:F-type H+-transporting ATPase subunit delta